MRVTDHHSYLTEGDFTREFETLPENVARDFFTDSTRFKDKTSSD
jgi:hypothetical protein